MNTRGEATNGEDPVRRLREFLDHPTHEELLDRLDLALEGAGNHDEINKRGNRYDTGEHLEPPAELKEGRTSEIRRKESHMHHGMAPRLRVNRNENHRRG